MRTASPMEGIRNTAEGWTAPQGAFMGVGVESAQHEPDLCPDPEGYDAFRFLRLKDAAGQGNIGNFKDDATLLELKHTRMIGTSDIVLPFGQGRRLCQGHFFVALELKMLLAYKVID